MPTCDSKAKSTSLGTLTAAELDHHASEAAKVKRTKEQAYFNSYDFDAIEVLPYDEDEEEEEEDEEESTRSHTFKQHQHHHHHGSQSGHHPKYTMGGCKACHQISQSASASPAPGISATLSHSHSLKNRPHHHQSQLQLQAQSQSLSKKMKKTTPSSYSQSSSSHSSSTSSSLSSFAHPMNATDSKRTYLERIGAFFTSHSIGKRASVESLTDIEKQAQQTSSSSATSSQISLDNNIRSVRKLYDDTGREHVVDDTVNSNFLLPRAMLKYQSAPGFGNSMPLAVISNLGGSSTSLRSNSINGQPIQVASGSGSHSKAQPNTVESSISASDAVNPKKPSTLAENSGFASSSATQTSAVATASSSSSLVSASSASALSAESSIKGETSPNADVTGASAPVAAVAVSSKSITSAVGSITGSLKQGFGEKLVSSTSSSSSSAGAVGGAVDGGAAASTSTSSSSSLTTTAGANGDAANATRGSSGRGARERTSSQSHYSTDKSGSSGYYSSNVCSTYSVEDHIYCEPVIDILEVSESATLKPSKLGQEGSGSTRKIMIVHNSDDDEEDHHHLRRHRVHGHQRQQEHMKQNLRVLESSIENLDRHLKNYPRLGSQERLASFVRPTPQTIPTHCFQIHGASGGGVFEGAKSRYGHLPTIMEGGAGDGQPMGLPKSWQEEIAEDSLLDIDLDSFLLVSEGKAKSTATVGGIDNPTFNKSGILDDEDMENNYKCAKYINSCPEDAYGLESEVGTTLDHFLKKYEDQIHFQNTRELLEDVRDKIRLLSESSDAIDSTTTVTVGRILEKHLPQELETMIKALKSELESYLERMNQHSEMEIRQLCTGLVKNQNIVKMKKAFERRKSNASDSEYDFAYEAIRDGGTIVTVQHTRQQIETTSIRCTSDPNFKMKRKSLCEVFPSVDAECYASTAALGASGGDASAGQSDPSGSGLNAGAVAVAAATAGALAQKTQLQRNLSFHKPILNQLSNGGEPGRDGDKDSILDWHRKKPSIWEMYYGTNRMNQTLLGKRGVITNGNQAILSYPSSRPESDFTLDLPRAEQLRIKMEKEKKFRRRCRYLTTFLSLVFFLLTVMVVSLVLTRGKRMFGSMI